MRDHLKKDATKFLQSNGLRMAYEEFGDPADPAILLVAGLYNQLVRWPLKFCELLVANGFRVIRFDNRDIGLTDKMDGVRAPSFFRLALKHYLRIPISAPYLWWRGSAATLWATDQRGRPFGSLVIVALGVSADGTEFVVKRVNAISTRGTRFSSIW
jgi:pimeloyl-ACP methyl ester carboxylesterase